MWQRILNRLNMSFFMYDIFLFFLQCKQGYCHRPYVWTLKSRNCGELSNLSLSYTHTRTHAHTHTRILSFYFTLSHNLFLSHTLKHKHGKFLLHALSLFYTHSQSLFSYTHTLYLFNTTVQQKRRTHILSISQ
jgi:hypothetical protein